MDFRTVPNANNFLPGRVLASQDGHCSLDLLVGTQYTLLILEIIYKWSWRNRSNVLEFV